MCDNAAHRTGLLQCDTLSHRAGPHLHRVVSVLGRERGRHVLATDELQRVEAFAAGLLGLRPAVHPETIDVLGVVLPLDAAGKPHGPVVLEKHPVGGDA